MTEEERIDKFIELYNLNLKLWLKLGSKAGLKSRQLAIWFKIHGEPTRRVIEEDMPYKAEMFHNPLEGVMR